MTMVGPTASGPAARPVNGPIRRWAAKTPLAPLLANVADSGPQFLWHHFWLHRTQWYPPARLRELQERRLRALVSHAYEQCPYYRRCFEAHGVLPTQIRGIDDLPSIPVLTRRAVVEHFAEIIAANAQTFRPKVGLTGGTTGVRLEFRRDRQTVSVGNAARWRIRAWHGIRFGHRIAEFRGRRDSSGAVDHTTISTYALGSRLLRVNLVPLEPRRLDAVAAEVSRFQPEAVATGSASWLASFSLYLLNSKHHIRPRVVFAGGERLFPDQRKVITEAFGAPVVEMYGNWEYVVFGGECEHGRLHLASETGIVEILKRGQRCSPGEAGEIVVTSLWNRAFPFIRYAIGDVGYMEEEACPCGRGLPTWRIVGGREKDLLATPNGYVELPVSIIATPWWRHKIVGIRFYQETRDEVLVQVVRGPAFAGEDTAALRAELAKYVGELIRVSIEFCDSIEQTQGGKYRYVVSKVPVEL